MVWKRTCSRVHASAALTQKVRNTTSYCNRNFLPPLKEKKVKIHIKQISKGGVWGTFSFATLNFDSKICFHLLFK